jgi:hypothetical protein
MTGTRDCPRVECGQALFADTMPPDRRESYERHRESCLACQECRDRAEDGTNALRKGRAGGAVPALAALAALALSGWLLAQAPPEPGQPRKEFYQDFRGGRPLPPALKLVGPDADAVARPEPEGLRLTLPATRPVNQPVGVATTFAVSGDFEITGTFELLSAERPANGYGVGVSLSIADSEARNKFAKVARALLVRGGSVFHSECWDGGPGKNHEVRTKPTESRLGQLRLVRKGPGLRYLAADGLGGDFQEIFSQDQFGTDDMGLVLLVVTDSGRPGNAIDARLVDFKIRAADLIPDPVAGAAPAAGPAAKPEREAGSKGWPAAAAVLLLVLLSGLAVCLVLFLRRRAGAAPAHGPAPGGEAGPSAAAPSVSVRCAGCGKVLKGKPELAGKKVKCPQCGEAVLVPPPDAGETGRAPS